MNGKCRKIHKKRILSRIVAEAYYTYQGVSQRSKKLQCGTPFLMGKSEHGGVLFQLAFLVLFLSLSPVKILVQIIEFSVESLYVFFSRFIGFLQGFFLGIQSIVIITKLINIKMF